MACEHRAEAWRTTIARAVGAIAVCTLLGVLIEGIARAADRTSGSQIGRTLQLQRQPARQQNARPFLQALNVRPVQTTDAMPHTSLAASIDSAIAQEASIAHAGKRYSIEDVAAINALISAPTNWPMSVEKQAMLPLRQWHSEYSGNMWSDFQSWLAPRYTTNMTRRSPDRDPHVMDRAPRVRGCVVALMPKYRAIYIKLQKVGGSSVARTLGWWCGKNGGNFDKAMFAENVGPCLLRPGQVSQKSPQFFGFESWEQLWHNYTVFTVVRNPFSKAASTHDYIQGKRAASAKVMKDAPGCAQPPFQHFTRQPYLYGVQDLLFHCSDEFKGFHSEPSFAFYHVDPQADCLFDDAGRPVFDMVLRTGSLDEDYQALAQRLNQQRAPHARALRTKLHSTNIGAAAQAQQAEESSAEHNSTASEHLNPYLRKYLQCGQKCISGVRQYYADDFQKLKFPTSRKQVQAELQS